MAEQMKPKELIATIPGFTVEDEPLTHPTQGDWLDGAVPARQQRSWDQFERDWMHITS